MNKVLKYIAMATLCTGIISCVESEPSLNPDQNAPAPENKVSGNSEDALGGQLIIRFDPSVSKTLEQAGLTKSGPCRPLTRSGLPSVDQILDMVDGYQIERVFPVDPRTEEKARHEGLHLWYVVKFSVEHSVEYVASQLSQLGEISHIEYNRSLKRTSTQKATPLTAEMLAKITRSSEQNLPFNDPHLGRQWHLVNNGGDFAASELNGTYPDPGKFIPGADVTVLPAWKHTTGNPEIIVAVMDEGVDVFHDDLELSIWVNPSEEYGSDVDADGNGYAGDRHGYNFVQNQSIISTNNDYDSGHGTHVAGVIAATNDNGIGIGSIAGGTPNKPGVRIMPCQIFAGTMVGSVIDEVRAIKYAADNGAVILQCSWGYISSAANPYENQPQFGSDDEWMAYNLLEYNAFDYFIHHAGSPDGVIEGGIAVFAAGNEYAPAAGYPGAYPKFVSVSSTAADWTPSAFTNYGPGTNIAAPGGDQDYYYEYGTGLNMGAVGCILSTLPESVTGDNGDFTGYGYMEGTSMACPHVSGVLALGLSYAAEKRLHFKAQDVISMLYESATPIAEVEKYWPDYKMYYKYVIDLGQLHPMGMELPLYKNKMGVGQVNAASLLEKMGAAGLPMTFPNVLVNLGQEKSYRASKYLDGASFTVTVADTKIASAVVEGDIVKIKGLALGQTKATINGQSFVITVRKAASENGWM